MREYKILLSDDAAAIYLSNAKAINEPLETALSYWLEPFAASLLYYVPEIE